MASPMLHVNVPQDLDMSATQAQSSSSSSSSSDSSGLDSPPARNGRKKHKPANAAPKPGACILPRCCYMISWVNAPAFAACGEMSHGASWDVMSCSRYEPDTCPHLLAGNRDSSSDHVSHLRLVL